MKAKLIGADQNISGDKEYYHPKIRENYYFQVYLPNGEIGKLILENVNLGYSRITGLAGDPRREELEVEIDLSIKINKIVKEKFEIKL